MSASLTSANLRSAVLNERIDLSKAPKTIWYPIEMRQAGGVKSIDTLPR